MWQSHHWARKLHARGHMVQLTAPIRDAARDVQVICDAVIQRTRQSVSVKTCRTADRTPSASRVTTLHESSTRSVQLDPLPAGVVWCRCVPNFIYVAYRVTELIEDANNELPDALLQFVARLIGRSSEGLGWWKVGCIPAYRAFTHLEQVSNWNREGL